MKYKLKVSDLVDSYWKFSGIWVLLRETNVLEAFYHPFVSQDPFDIYI